MDRQSVKLHSNISLPADCAEIKSIYFDQRNKDVWILDGSMITNHSTSLKFASSDPIAIDPLIPDPLFVDTTLTDPLTTDPLFIDTPLTDPLFIGPTLTDPLAIGSLGTDPLACNPLSADPLALDTLVPDPLKTEPLTIDPLATDSFADNPLANAIKIPKLLTIDPLAADPLAVDSFAHELLKADLLDTNPIKTDALPSDSLATDPFVVNPVISDYAPSDPQTTPKSLHRFSSNSLTLNSASSNSSCSVTVPTKFVHIDSISTNPVVTDLMNNHSTNTPFSTNSSEVDLLFTSNTLSSQDPLHVTSLTKTLNSAGKDASEEVQAEQLTMKIQKKLLHTISKVHEGDVHGSPLQDLQRKRTKKCQPGLPTELCSIGAAPSPADRESYQMMRSVLGEVLVRAIRAVSKKQKCNNNNGGRMPGNVRMQRSRTTDSKTRLGTLRKTNKNPKTPKSVHSLTNLPPLLPGITNLNLLGTDVSKGQRREPGSMRSNEEDERGLMSDCVVVWSKTADPINSVPTSQSKHNVLDMPAQVVEVTKESEEMGQKQSNSFTRKATKIQDCFVRLDRININHQYDSTEKVSLRNVCVQKNKIRKTNTRKNIYTEKNSVTGINAIYSEGEIAERKGKEGKNAEGKYGSMHDCLVLLDRCPVKQTDSSLSSKNATKSVNKTGFEEVIIVEEQLFDRKRSRELRANTQQRNSSVHKKSMKMHAESLTAVLATKDTGKLDRKDVGLSLSCVESREGTLRTDLRVNKKNEESRCEVSKQHTTGSHNLLASGQEMKSTKMTVAKRLTERQCRKLTWTEKQKQKEGRIDHIEELMSEDVVPKKDKLYGTSTGEVQIIQSMRKNDCEENVLKISINKKAKSMYHPPHTTAGMPGCSTSTSLSTEKNSRPKSSVVVPFTVLSEASSVKYLSQKSSHPVRPKNVKVNHSIHTTSSTMQPRGTFVKMLPPGTSSRVHRARPEKTFAGTFSPNSPVAVITSDSSVRISSDVNQSLLLSQDTLGMSSSEGTSGALPTKGSATGDGIFNVSHVTPSQDVSSTLSSKETQNSAPKSLLSAQLPQSSPVTISSTESSDEISSRIPSDPLLSRSTHESCVASDIVSTEGQTTVLISPEVELSFLSSSNAHLTSYQDNSSALSFQVPSPTLPSTFSSLKLLSNNTSDVLQVYSADTSTAPFHMLSTVRSGGFSSTSSHCIASGLQGTALNVPSSSSSTVNFQHRLSSLSSQARTFQCAPEPLRVCPQRRSSIVQSCNDSPHRSSSVLSAVTSLPPSSQGKSAPKLTGMQDTSTTPVSNLSSHMPQYIVSAPLSRVTVSSPSLKASSGIMQQYTRSNCSTVPSRLSTVVTSQCASSMHLSSPSTPMYQDTLSGVLTQQTISTQHKKRTNTKIGSDSCSSTLMCVDDAHTFPLQSSTTALSSESDTKSEGTNVTASEGRSGSLSRTYINPFALKNLKLQRQKLLYGCKPRS